MDSKRKRIFGIACLGKLLSSHTELCEIRKKLSLKTGLLHRVNDLIKSIQTWNGVCPMYVGCKTKTIFAMARLGKNSVFLTQVYYFNEYRNLNYLLYRLWNFLSQTRLRKQSSQFM